MKINNDFFSFCHPSLFLFMLGLDWLCCLSLYSHSQAGQASSQQYRSSRPQPQLINKTEI